MKVSNENVFVNEIKQILEQARQRAYSAVNTAMVEAYWQIGKRIVEEEQQGKERAEYGKEILKTLSSELGEGFSTRNLRDIRQFYLTFSDWEKWHTLCAKLNWSHIRLKKHEKHSTPYHHSHHIYISRLCSKNDVAPDR